MSSIQSHQDTILEKLFLVAINQSVFVGLRNVFLCNLSSSLEM